MRIVNAIQHERVLRIVYVGLKYGETPAFRRILPLALERMNDQWRVIAQDIEQEDAPIRVFVLSRILDAEADLGRRPKRFVLQGHTDSVTDLEVKLNPRLTPAQQEVLSRELRVESGKVRVATRSLHEFKRRFADTPISKDAVWPPLLIKDGS
jgi:predicted DNA-binding transcriptional regulator YafY